MKRPDDNVLIILAFVIGVPVFLLLGYPLLFILGTVKFINRLKK